MSGAFADPGSSPPAALAAFLRGTERRAAVFAELQAGDSAAGDAAVAVAIHQWHARAAAMEMGQWPLQFWSLLLSQPQLRVRTPVALPLEASDRLGELAAQPRAALLLRLAAGLEEAAAAAAMGISGQDYRRTLQQALPREADGSPDLQAWDRLREEVQRRTRTLPPARLLRLSSAREAVLRGESRPNVAQAGAPRVASGWRRPLLLTLWGLLAACALALGATFLPSAGDWLGRRGDVAAGNGELPDVPAAAYYSAEAGLVAHPDFALLADPAATDAADLAFHSWLAAQPEGGIEGARRSLTTSEPRPADPAPDSAHGETDDASI